VKIFKTLVAHLKSCLPSSWHNLLFETPITTLNQIFHKKKCHLTGWHFSRKLAGVGGSSLILLSLSYQPQIQGESFSHFLPRRPAASFAPLAPLSRAKNDNLKWSVPGGTIIYLPRFFSLLCTHSPGGRINLGLALILSTSSCACVHPLSAKKAHRGEKVYFTF
jgi:hypothetical protein